VLASASGGGPIGCENAPVTSLLVPLAVTLLLLR